MSKTQKTKKIGFYTTILMTAAATIGAGIFFKNGELFSLSHGNLGWVISAWLVAAVAIMALGLATVELVSAQKGNGGVFGWTRTFVTPKFHKILVNFNKYIYVPASLLTLPIYVTMTLEDSGMTLPAGWAVGLVSFGIFMYFMLFNLLSIKITSSFQWLSMIGKIIPLIAIPIIAFIGAGDVVGGSESSAPAGVNGVHPFMVILAGIPAIAFAYDGFQTTASIKEDMKQPDKIGMSMVFGLIIITAFYLFVTIAFGVGSSSGTIFGITMSDAAFSAFNVFIALGIMGIVNGFTISSTRQLADSAEQGEANEIMFIGKVFFKTNNLSKKQLFKSSWLYIVLSVSLLFVIIIPIGSYAFSINDYGSDYAETSATLYTLVDFLVNFTSLIAMLTVVAAAIGGLVNRRTNKVEVKKSPYFVYSAWIASAIFMLTGVWLILSTVIDAFGYNGADQKSSLIKFLILIAFGAISVLPVLIGPLVVKKPGMVK